MCRNKDITLAEVLHVQMSSIDRQCKNCMQLQLIVYGIFSDIMIMHMMVTYNSLSMI